MLKLKHCFNFTLKSRRRISLEERRSLNVLENVQKILSGALMIPRVHTTTIYSKYTNIYSDFEVSFSLFYKDKDSGVYKLHYP